MARAFSLLVLIATVLLVGVFFARIIWPFVFPLLFSAILAVLFRPVYSAMVRACRGRRRIAAALTTTAVFFLLMLPLTGVLLLAGMELVAAGRDAVAYVDSLQLPEAEAEVNDDTDSLLAKLFTNIESYLTPEELGQLQEIVTSTIPALTRTIYERTRSLVGDVIVVAIGAVVIVLGFYYLLAEGDKLEAEARRLSPFEREDQQVLFQQFEDVCRGVVLGTVAAGLVQGVLAGLGFAIVGVERIWLLAVLTMSASFIPFLGAAMIWLGVAFALLFEQRYLAAGFLAVYGTIVISGSDNLIKAYVIGNRARMHPFMVLVTVLGAIQFVGLWGVFLGPITAAFFYSLINILHQKFAPPAPAAVPEATGSEAAEPESTPAAEARQSGESDQEEHDRVTE